MNNNVTDDLLPWLREQIAETLRVAEATLDQPSDSGHWQIEARIEEGKIVSARRVFVPPRAGSEEDAAHIALNDPRTVLASCEAHTALLDYADAMSRPQVAMLADELPADLAALVPSVTAAAEVGASHLRALVALAYQHRPGYREEWGP